MCCRIRKKGIIARFWKHDHGDGGGGCFSGGDSGGCVCGHAAVARLGVAGRTVVLLLFNLNLFFIARCIRSN